MTPGQHQTNPKSLLAVFASWNSAAIPSTSCVWPNYSELTVSSLLNYEVVISEHVGFSAHGRPERGESAGETHNPGGRRPPGRRRRVVGFGVGFCSALAGHV